MQHFLDDLVVGVERVVDGLDALGAADAGPGVLDVGHGAVVDGVHVVRNQLRVHRAVQLLLVHDLRLHLKMRELCSERACATA